MPECALKATVGLSPVSVGFGRASAPAALEPAAGVAPPHAAIVNASADPQRKVLMFRILSGFASRADCLLTACRVSCLMSAMQITVARQSTRIPKVLVACALVGAGLTACFAELPDPSKCRFVPSGGCPESGNTDVCAADPTCEAVYRCTDSRWTLLAACTRDARDAGVRTDSAADSSAVTDAAARVDSGRAVPEGGYGGPTCNMLQAPDCPAATAILCPSGCCGCEDLFVCAAGTWNAWGLCTSAGIRELAASQQP